MQLSDTTLISDANLEAYYKFESGVLTTDSSGDGETLSNINTVGEGAGRYGGGANFGTANTDKRFERGTSLGITRTFTMGCWVNVNTAIASGSWDFVEILNDTTDNIFELFYDYNGGTKRIRGQSYKVGTDSSVSITHNVDLGVGSWHHVAFGADGTNQYLWYNGSLVAGPTTMAPVGSNSLDNRINIGANRVSTGGGYGDPGPNRFASAIIDEVFVFSRKLTNEEVALLASGGGAGNALFFNPGLAIG